MVLLTTLVYGCVPLPVLNNQSTESLVTAINEPDAESLMQLYIYKSDSVSGQSVRDGYFVMFNPEEKKTPQVDRDKKAVIIYQD